MKRSLLLVPICLTITGAVAWGGFPFSRVAIPTAAPLHGLNALAPETPTPTRHPVASISAPHATARPVGTPAPQAPNTKAASYLVLIVLDGARPDYFNVSGIPHVRQLLNNGTQYRNAWAGILESETPSGHASITSGSEPRNDGILSFDWANSDNLPVSIFNTKAVLGGDLERYMHDAPASSIAALLHRQNPKAKVVALSGYKYYAADALGGPNADVTMYFNDRANGTFGPAAIPGKMPPPGILNDPSLILPSRSYPLGIGDHLAMKLAAATFQKMHQQGTLINLPEFDWPLGHVDGANRDPQGVQTLMRGFDRDLAMLEDRYRQAGVLDKTVFVLTADHGFAPIDHKVSHTIVNQAVDATGTTIIRDSYHTAGYVWIKDESKAAQAAENIAARQNPYVQSVYFRTTGPFGTTYIRATGSDLLRDPGTEAANQYLLNTFNGPNGPDIAVFMTEHSMLVAGAESTWKGDHGGAAWDSQHLPLIISGPGVTRGAISNFPARLMDIAPTVLSVMHVPTTGMQGIRLADAMTGASAQDRAHQATLGTMLNPVVAALQRESAQELLTVR